MADKVKMTKREMLRLEASTRRAEKLFAVLARNENKTVEVQNRANKKIEDFSRSEKEKIGPRLAKLSEKHKQTFDQLCDVVETIENRSGHKLFATMLGRYGIRALANAVELEEGFTYDDVIKYLEDNNMGEYVEVAKTLKKNPLKEDMPDVPGLVYVGKTGKEEYFSAVKSPGDKKPSVTTKPRRKRVG